MNDFSYNNWHQYSDQALAEMIGKFIRHQRLQQNKSQEDVSADAGISRSTLSLLERGEAVSLSTLLKVLRVLDLLHVMKAFEVKEEISPLLYAKMQKQKRQRASGSKAAEPDEDIGW